MSDPLGDLDKRYVWHPFTQMRDWCAADHEPLVIERGEGVRLFDSQGNGYIDGNSSIWTNVHGHNHPAINAAISDQLGKLAHSSFLGFTNEPAIRLAEKLVGLFPGRTLTKVFYGDNGSTAMECAIKMAIQFWQLEGREEKCEFAAFDLAYHGDTMGAATLGGISVFHDRFAKFGLAKHEVASIAALEALPKEVVRRLAAVAIEPLVQGAAGIRLWPDGMLQKLRAWCDRNEVLLILDEVMTGFGRTGKMFACEHEGVTPDFIALAKGLTGGYLPLAATLTTERIYDAFLGSYEESKTFFYGHTFCGNPLGCAAALANLEIFESESVLCDLQPKIAKLRELLASLAQSKGTHVGDVRQCGFIAGVDIVDGDNLYPWEAQTGAKICMEARKHGLLTRPIRDTIVLMPPLSISETELEQAVSAISAAIDTL